MSRTLVSDNARCKTKQIWKHTATASGHKLCPVAFAGQESSAGTSSNHDGSSPICQGCQSQTCETKIVTALCGHTDPERN